MAEDPIMLMVQQNPENKTIKGNSTIRISRGPQFRTKGGVIIAMLFLASLITSIAFLINAEFIDSLICLTISIILFSLILDIHGIEVDTYKHKIRDYKLILWTRIGNWENINDFKFIYLTQENVVVGTSEYSEHASDTYHYYFIKLVDELNNKEIVLGEFRNYYKALYLAKNIAHATGLVFRILLQKGNRKKYK